MVGDLLELQRHVRRWYVDGLHLSQSVLGVEPGGLGALSHGLHLVVPGAHLSVGRPEGYGTLVEGLEVGVEGRGVVAEAVDDVGEDVEDVAAVGAEHLRSEERRVGEEWVSKCRFRWSPNN